MYTTDISSITPGKSYTRNELVLLETSISQFYRRYKTPAIQNWRFIYHVVLLFEHITVENNSASHINVGTNNMMFYAGVITKI